MTNFNFQPSGLTDRGSVGSDNLLAGDFPAETTSVTILDGSGVLLRGTVLEIASKPTAASAAKSGGNTGNGTLTLDATTPVLAATTPTGVYTVRLITAASNAGTFRVTAPDGTVLGDVAVGSTFSNRIKFATADGATDFIVGDGFDITVTAPTAIKYQEVTSNANALYILAEDVDATDDDVVTTAYVTGKFNKRALSVGDGASVAGVAVVLQPRSIFIVDSVPA